MALEQGKNYCLKTSNFLFVMHFSKTLKLLWIWENYFKHLKH